MDLQGGTGGKLLDASSIHILGMLEEKLIVIKVLSHLLMLFSSFLVL